MTGALASFGEAVKALVKRTLIVVAIVAGVFTGIGIATGVHDMITDPQPPVVGQP